MPEYNIGAILVEKILFCKENNIIVQTSTISPLLNDFTESAGFVFTLLKNAVRLKLQIMNKQRVNEIPSYSAEEILKPLGTT